ncbi:pre-B-cell leukemia homeobox interacting protein 1b isoform X2 [Synchiropus splendidus]|uniref:pre-B-cell leukemia homeobox interacting protein 1b isoform X2 n=1 Tax=Synchiropus splendidus TaxID=270530 RepID=UPI00237D5259|nr:pre-B-cell leukemia homeobox interacting protein 1b isoform X2 [Synchiropus splendidus]
MSGVGSPNTWTIVSPEETETLRPLAEETEQHEHEKHSTDVQDFKTHPADASPVLEPEHQEAVKDEFTSANEAVSEVTISSSGSHDTHCQSEGAVGDSSLNTDSFSDSWSHMTLTPDEASGSFVTPETLVGSESTQEDDNTPHPENEEEVPSGEEGTHLSSLTEPAACAEESHATAEPELRRRRSLLATLERIGRTEEEEEVEEDFQLPRREEEESWFTLNKCLLGAVLLVGLGTIFFSGVFMDLDEESDYVSGELKDAEVRGKQEWTDPVAPPPNLDASELQDKIAGEDERISLLQAEHTAQNQELKVSPALAAERAAEQLHREEDSSGLRKTMETLTLLQKENERMRRELESVPGLQEEVNTLKSAVTELKRPTASQPASTLTTSPSGGHTENGVSEEFPAEKVKARKKEKHDKGDKKQWKERERTDREEERDWKNEKVNKGKENKHKSHKEWKQKERRGDDGKPWKDRENEEWGEKKERKDKQWRQHEKPDGGSYSKRKDNGENSRERNDYRVKKDWHNEEKMDHGEEWKDKRERKDWRRGEERHLKNDHDRKQWKEGREEGGERYGKGKDERKLWQDGERYGKKKDERKHWDEGERFGERRDEGERYGKGKDERKQWDEGERYGKGRDERKQWVEGERFGKGRDEKKKRDTKEHDREERKQWKEDGWRSRKGEREKDTGKKNERKEWEGVKEARRGNEGKRWRDKGMKRDEDHDPAMEERNEKWQRKEESWSKERKKHDGEWRRDGPSQKHAKEEHLWADRKPVHSHRRLTLDQPEYWSHQRGRLQGNPKPRDLCSSLEACAQAEGLLPVPLSEFQTVLQTYLSKAEQFGVESAKRDELFKLAAEFFKDGLFVHDQMRFQDFADDVSDILEDLVEGDEEDDSALEDEMEDFGKEVVRRFLVPEQRVKGERKKESSWPRG